MSQCGDLAMRGDVGKVAISRLGTKQGQGKMSCLWGDTMFRGVGVRPRMELRECFGLEAVIVVRQTRAATGTIPDSF